MLGATVDVSRDNLFVDLRSPGRFASFTRFRQQVVVEVLGDALNAVPPGVVGAGRQDKTAFLSWRPHREKEVRNVAGLI